jgi:hypothetical protein
MAVQELKLSDVQGLLPREARNWVNGMTHEEKHSTEIILNNVGIESFVRHWKEHREEVQEVRDF